MQALGQGAAAGALLYNGRAMVGGPQLTFSMSQRQMLHCRASPRCSSGRHRTVCCSSIVAGALLVGAGAPLLLEEGGLLGPGKGGSRLPSIPKKP